MKKHRGLFLAFGLLGLIGMLPQAANAGTLTMVVSWSGGSLTITPGSPNVTGTSSNDSFNVNVGTLNGDLAAAKINLAFTNLSANTQGAAPGEFYPTSGTLNQNGSVGFANNGGTAAGSDSVTITTFISGFSAPTGNGTVSSTSTANFTNTGAGATQVWSTSYQGATANASSFTSTGASPDSQSSPTLTKNIGPIAAGYELDNASTITLAKGTDAFSVSTVLTGASVPEPASIVLMLTSMPLPLVVMGLIRRRRRAVA